MILRRILFLLIAGFAGAAEARNEHREYEAGASTFEAGGALYRVEPLRAEDVRVPEVVIPEEEPGAGDSGEAKAPPEQAGTRFAIDRFDVTGNTLLTETRIAGILSPWVGKDRSIADIQAARDALQAVYEELGLLTIAVTIPAQTVEAGRVRLHVVEARIGEVAIENPGVDWVDADWVRARTPHLKSGALLRRDDLQSDLARANENVDVRVRPVVKSGREPGTVDVKLRVDDRVPFHGGLTASSDRSAGAPRSWTRAEASYSNLWKLGHQIGLSWQVAPTKRWDDVQIVAGTYQAPMPWSEKQTLFFYTVWSDTKNGITDSPGLSVLGNGLNMGLRYRAALPEFESAPDYTHALTFALDRKDVENTLQSGGVEVRTPITYLPFGFEYSGNLVLDHGFVSAQTGMTAHVAGTLPGGGRSDFQKNRPDNDATGKSGSSGTFVVGTFGVQAGVRLSSTLRVLAAGRMIDLPDRDRSFGDDWMLLFRSRGQVASEPLISTEQFSAGGLQSVRGYLRSEHFGDDGWNGQFEITSPFYRHFARGLLDEAIQGLVFYDAAATHFQNAAEGARTWQTLQSYGAGVRLRFFDRLRAEFFVSHPVDTTKNTPGRSTQFTFQVGAGF
ncbi:MAG: POTRA domain-containing protein [Myxococcota bacterium]